MAFDRRTNIEQRLLARQIAPPPALQAKVLAAVARELAQPAPRPASTIWSYLAAAAAITIVSLNLAHMSAMVTDFVRQPEPDPHQAVALAASIQQALPDLPPGEAQRMALKLSAAQRLVPVPIVHGSSMSMEQSRWIQPRSGGSQ